MKTNKIIRGIIVICLLLAFSQATSAQTKKLKNEFDYEVNMLICYGQSLSVGGGATNGKSNFRNILSFQGGCNEWGAKLDLSDAKAVQSFYGNRLVYLDSLKGKGWPPVAAAAVSWMNLLEEENGIDMAKTSNHFLLSTPGYHGTKIEKLSQGTNFYERLLYSVTKGAELADKESKSFGVPVVFWVQGESNIEDTEEEYLQKLEKLFADLNKDIKAITKQKKDVVFISYQTAPVIGTIPYPSKEDPRNYSDSGPSFAQLKISHTGKNIYMGGAMYQYQYGDLWHPKDRAVVGIQLGIAAKRIISDGDKWKTFAPKSHTVKKSKDKWTVHVRFDVPVLPMRFDTSGGHYHNLNGKQPNYGFSLVNEKGEDIIEKEPEIKNGHTLVITCHQNPKNAILKYALNGHYGGGNLCDSQNIIIQNKGADYPMDNFCPAFRDYRIK